MPARRKVVLLLQLVLQASLIAVRLFIVIISLKLHLHLKIFSMKKEFSKSMKKRVPHDFALELQKIYENRLREEARALSFRGALKTIMDNLR